MSKAERLRPNFEEKGNDLANFVYICAQIYSGADIDNDIFRSQCKELELLLRRTELDTEKPNFPSAGSITRTIAGDMKTEFGEERPYLKNPLGPVHYIRQDLNNVSDRTTEITVGDCVDLSYFLRRVVQIYDEILEPS